MIRAVLDANGLASASITNRTPPGQLVDLWQLHRFELVLSDHLLAEVERTLAKPYFRARLSPAQVIGFLRLLEADATFIALTETVTGVASHPEDDLVLATAASAQADFLITGDRDLLRLGSFHGTVIVTPRDFLAMLPGL